MPGLEPPDTFYLSAAVGWLELGNTMESEAEWARISPAQQGQPEVLEVRWQICAAAENWDKALAVATELLRLEPGKASSWIHHAYSLRRVSTGGLQAAFNALLPAFAQFPKEAIIPYNLACYTAQLNRLDEAWDWLGQAMKRSKRSAIKQMALADADLEPLWPRLQK